MVRGKTGTLRQVYSLAGFVRTTDGTLIAYAFITNGATGEFAAKTWLDQVAAAGGRLRLPGLTPRPEFAASRPTSA